MAIDPLYGVAIRSLQAVAFFGFAFADNGGGADSESPHVGRTFPLVVIVLSLACANVVTLVLRVRRSPRGGGDQALRTIATWMDGAIVGFATVGTIRFFWTAG